MSSIKLPASKTKAYRELTLVKQDMRCAITGYTLSLSEAVADHCHKTGHHRGVIHRGVNALLGKLENNAARYGVSTPMFIAMCAGLPEYLRKDYSDNPLHYTYRTPDEKRERINEQARRRRAAKKETKA